MPIALLQPLPSVPLFHRLHTTHSLTLSHAYTHSLTHPRHAILLTTTPTRVPLPGPTRHIPRGAAKSLTVTLTQTAVAPTTADSSQSSIPYTPYYRRNVTTDHPAASPAPGRRNCCQPELAPDPSSSQSQARAVTKSRCHPLALQ